MPVGVVVARLAFVWEFRSAYLASPLDMLDIRDGGWSATAGFVGAWLFALSQHGRLIGGLLKGHGMVAAVHQWAGSKRKGGQCS